MAGFSLVELKANDELVDVVKKTNTNFRNLSYATKQNIASSGGDDSAWKKAIAELTAEMEQKITSLENQLASTKKTMDNMVPPVGAVLIQINDPVLEYPGTQWEPQDYGNHPLWVTYDRNLHGNYLCELFDEDGNKIKFTMKKADGDASENGTPLPYLAWQRVR